MVLNDLERLIPQYAQNKLELDSYKKLCDRENAKIKSIMKDFSLQRYEAGGYKATYTLQQRESMSEDILLSLFTSVPGFVGIANECGIVKTKEYIDFDALEKSIYDGKFSDEMILELQKAKNVKEVVTLKVTKIKEKKDEEE